MLPSVQHIRSAFVLVTSAVLTLTACAGAPRERVSKGQAAQAILASASSGANRLATVRQAAAAANPSTEPGADPAIQRWFLVVDKAKAAFDQALFQAQRGIVSRTAADCAALARSSTAIRGALPKLRALPSAAGAKIADAVDPLMVTMSSIARLCTQDNFSDAQTLLNSTGIPQQANTQALIDEILDGGR